MRKTTATGLACMFALVGHSPSAQTTQPGPDSKPASTNAPGQPYPQVDSQRQATFRLVAPNAQTVRVNLGGGTPLVKGPDGVWTGTTRPLDPGFAGFSGGGTADVRNGYNGALRDANAFNAKVKVFYLSMGTKENIENFRRTRTAVEAAGIKLTAYEAPAPPTSSRPGARASTASPN